MSDNIFDRLAEMLASSESVNWELAAELGTSIAGNEGALSPGSDAHWNEYVETARHFLADVPGIRPQTDFEVHVVDRRQWTSAQVRGFEYLATPLAEKLREDPSNPMGALFSILVGLQVGSMAGSLSHRVMGNFEAALPPLSSSGLWLVAPNIEEFSTDHGLDSKQVDLWVALNELIHASMFAMPGAPQRLRNLVSTYIEGLEFNPQALPMDPMAQGFDPEELGRIVQDPSFLSDLFTGSHREEDLAEIQTFVAVVEGFPEYVLGSLDPKLLPELPALQEAIDRRRATPSAGEQFLQRLLGIDLEGPLHRAAAEFFAEIGQRWGPDSAVRMWASTESFPHSHELEDPVAWAARVLLP